MKKLLCSFVTCLLAATATLAQCDKTVVYHSDKQEMINPEGEVIDNKTDVLTIEFSKEKIAISKEGKPDVMLAIIKGTTCEWKELYKEGKAVYKVDFQRPNSSETSEGSMTVEGKDGKLNILVEMARLDGKKIRVIVNKYEEK